MDDRKKGRKPKLRIPLSEKNRKLAEEICDEIYHTSIEMMEIRKAYRSDISKYRRYIEFPEEGCCEIQNESDGDLTIADVLTEETLCGIWENETNKIQAKLDTLDADLLDHRERFQCLYDILERHKEMTPAALVLKYPNHSKRSLMGLISVYVSLFIECRYKNSKPERCARDPKGCLERCLFEPAHLYLLCQEKDDLEEDVSETKDMILDLIGSDISISKALGLSGKKEPSEKSGVKHAADVLVGKLFEVSSSTVADERKKLNR